METKEVIAASSTRAAGGWQPIDENDPAYGERVLIFSPAYPEGDPMRYRMVSWVTKMTDATHFQRITPPEQPTKESEK